MPEYKGAFAHCSWCHGNGCMMCDQEREKWIAAKSKPMFSADRNNPDDMAALKRVFGADNLTEAFGPNGGGIRQIEEQAAIESLLQLIRKNSKATTEDRP